VRAGAAARTAAIAVVVTLMVAGCGATPSDSAPSSAAGTSPGAPASSGLASPTPLEPTDAGTATPGPATAGSGGAIGGIAVDATLLDALPAEVDGTPVESDDATAAEVAGSSALAPSVAGVAVATAFGSGDYVVATVVRLRDGVFGDAFYRDWRDSFDGGVCAQAGGVEGHAETDIAGHRTYIGTCVGGVHTYHVHLASRGLLISAQALGERRYGELLIQGLAE
jgi:hypothetical protein